MKLITAKELVTELLIIAEYKGDKDKFALEFDSFNMLDAILAIYKTLPQESQEFIKAHPEDPQAILQHIPREAYEAKYIEVTKRELQNMIHRLDSALTLKQREKISALVAAL